MRTHSAPIVMSLLLATCVLVGCGGGGRQDFRTGQPLIDARSPMLAEAERIDAMREAWGRSLAGSLERDEVRDALGSIAMASNSPLPLRTEALRLLLADDHADAEAENRQLAIDLLPHEPSREVVELLGSAAVERGWVEVVPSLVRSLSRPSASIADSDRPEVGLLRELRPDATIEQLVFEVFLNPPARSDMPGIDWAQRVRADAWALLGRLDSDGSLRASLLQSTQLSAASDPQSQRVLADLRAAWSDLACVPLTGEELTWLTRLRSERNVAWWRQSAAAIAMLTDERRNGLRLMHAEPIRWASRSMPSWLAASRGSLIEELTRRLGQREVVQRSQRQNPDDPLPSESLDQWRDGLSWADCLALLVLDEALGRSDLRPVVFRHADLDHSDTTTEYGGVVRPSEEAIDQHVLVLYAPRPAQRQGDDVFVASSDMIESSDQALAHYHFHIQRWSNRSYAGPSAGDMEYAQRMGRLCAVITGVRQNELNIDALLPTGAVIDMGVIGRRP